MTKRTNKSRSSKSSLTPHLKSSLFDLETTPEKGCIKLLKPETQIEDIIHEFYRFKIVKKSDCEY